jgi:hypothetical protein
MSEPTCELTTSTLPAAELADVAARPDGIPLAVLDLVEQMGADEMVAQKNATPGWQALNRFERVCAEGEQLPCPLVHTFTPVPEHPELHLYTRQIVMPTGSLIFSRVHLFEHPFIISGGVVSIWGVETGWVTLRAPHLGVTMPGTRRVLYIHEETTFTTFHVTKETDPDLIVAQVTYDHLKLGHMEDLPPAQLEAVQANAMTKGKLQ